MMKKKKILLKKAFSVFCACLLVAGLIPINSAKAETNSYLPKTKKAEEVIVLDLSHDLKNKDGEAKEAYMAITSIQGIVNRDSTTKIYLTHTPQEHDWTPYAADESYLEKGLIPAKEIYPSLNYGKKYPVLSYLLEQYHEQIAGKIQVPQLSGKIIDGAIMAGVTAAGVEDSILTSTNIEKYIEKEGYSFDVKANTRNFKNNIDSFEWAYENYFERCNKTFAAQHTFTAFGGGMDDQFPIMYDYYVSSQVFVFSLDGNKPEELAKLQSFLVPENYEPGTAVLGLPVDEGKGISCISDSGYYFAIMYVPNLTVTSSFEYDQSSIQEPAQPVAAPTDNNTNYVAFFATDGDSMGFPTNFMYEHITNSSSRGEVPIGWSFNPHLIDLFPTLLSYYSKNDYNSFYEYVASMNNGGSPRNEIGAEVFKNRYIDYVNKANEMFRTINYFNDDIYINDLTTAIDPYLLIKGYQGQTNGNDVEWGQIDDSQITFTTMSGATQGNAKTENIYAALKKISDSKNASQPTFTVVCVGDGRWSEDSTKHVNEAIKKLRQDNPDQNYTFMRPTDLAATYKSYQGDESVPVGNPKVVTLENKNEVNEISVDKSAIELVEGKETSIKGYAMDDQKQLISGKTIAYESQDATIATVDNNGTVKALKEGETTIVVSCEGKETTVNVTVTGRKATSIAVDKEVISTAVEGQTTIKAELYDQFGQILPDAEFTWSSSDDTVVAVDNGVITGLKAGTADITVSYNEIQTQIHITVLESAESISRIVIEPSYLEMYEGDIYNVTVNAYDSNNNEVFGFTPKWSIQDAELATIDTDGYITGVKSGYTKVTATFGDSVSEDIDLQVKKDDSPKIIFENTTDNEYIETIDDIVSFEAGSFKGYGKQGSIQGKAIKLDDERFEKAFTFKEKTILKSIKAFNPTDEIITLTLNAGLDGSMSYKIKPQKSLTLKTNFQTENGTYVIKTTNTDIAFGEFVYGKADPIATTLEINQGADQISITKDSQLDLSATLYDQNHKELDYDHIEWSTDRNDIVSVDNNGRITGIAEGSTFIYAKTSGLVASVLVYVTESQVDRIEVSTPAITCYVGDIIPVTAIAYDKDNQELHFTTTWTSKDEAIASIDKNNYVKALKTGITQIKVNISGLEKIIPVYIKEHPESDQIIDFTQFNNGDFANGLINERVTFEDDFWVVKDNVPEINGKAVHLKDENTGEKAFSFNTPTTVKSIKVHNPTEIERLVAIKTIDSSLPKVDYVIPAGETLTIYTQYTGQTKGYAIQTYYQVLIGEIVYTDTLETGFTAAEIAQGITSIEQPKFAQTQLELPQVNGFDISIAESSHPDIIKKDGSIDALGIDQDVKVTLQVVKQTANQANRTTAQTASLTIKVLGIPANTLKLEETIELANQKDLTLYTPSTVNKFKKALEAAKQAVENKALRQREVNDIQSSLETATKGLLEKANKSALQTLLDDIKEINDSDYTPHSLEKRDALIKKAKDIINDQEVKQSEVDRIVTELNDAIKNLTKKADKTELKNLYEKLVSKDLTSFTDESIHTYKEILNQMKNILDDLNISQSDVDKALATLKQAEDKLVKKAVIVPNPNNTDNSNDVNKPASDDVKTEDYTSSYLATILLSFSILGILVMKKRKTH